MTPRLDSFQSNLDGHRTRKRGLVISQSFDEPDELFGHDAMPLDSGVPVFPKRGDLIGVNEQVDVSVSVFSRALSQA